MWPNHCMGNTYEYTLIDGENAPRKIRASRYVPCVGGATYPFNKGNLYVAAVAWPNSVLW
eukprot:COSAG02_NODE_3678_length_6391_cov_3.177845_3_plen_60_part_00